ncbi:MAG: cell-cell cohesion protein MtsF [Myxococcaceae bacterium]|nr:cell-cell cohesion protein MtsF [Myxococcaceae bacterium]
MSKFARLLPLASLLLLAACPGEEPDPGPDGGTEPIPDLCNSREEALSEANCELTVGQQLERHISEPGDRDWYSVRIPANANPRTLVRVTAGYLAASTAVNLSVNLLREDGQSSLARAVDAHGQGAPKPVEIILPFSEPNARLLLLLADEPTSPTRPNFDARSPYFVKVEVLENPDTQEPNDTPEQATGLTLQTQGNVQVGTSTGYLATTNDVDRFTFDMPADKVAYVRLYAEELRPPPPYRLSYVLLRPDGTAESEGQVANATIAADLATARRVKTAGTWTVVVRGYQRAGDSTPIPGDLRLRYNLEVRVMDEQDPQDLNGDNDVLERALVRTIGVGPGSSTTFSGRIGSVSDADWYAVDVPTSSQPTVLYYRVREAAGGGRFPPLPGFVDRQLRVFTQVSQGATVPDRRAACISDAAACPKGYSEVPSADLLVAAYCNTSVPEPLCIHASREEEPQNFPDLRNFEGALPVPPHAGNLRYYFVVQDDGNNWADDKDYTLQVSWLSDTDEQDRTEPPSAVPLANDSSGASFPAPPAGATVLNGELNFGFGRLQPDDRAEGKGVRGPGDYDAVPTDVDSYILSLPTGLPEPLDKTWELQWEVQHLPDGGMPHGLAMDLTFCDADRPDAGALCTPVRTGSRGAPLTLAFREEPLRAWHSPSGSLSGLQPLYAKEVSAGSTTFTVQPYACSCLEPRFVRGGTVRVDVTASERYSYERVSYTVRTAYTSYPKSYAADGGSRMCPAPQQDGGTALPDGGTSPVGYAPGCRFTLQP